MDIYYYLKQKNDAFALTPVERKLFPYICAIKFSQILKDHPCVSLPLQYLPFIKELNL